MLATSVQPLLSKLLTCSVCSCIVYCRGTFNTIVSVGEQEKKPKLKAGAFAVVLVASRISVAQLP